ncbi:MAG TPA: hypothetical protein PK246_09105 [Saprospiraceae bacterium]|nr:hypothetical protein [Lewinellaceae bacterium]HPK10477.1 hypothetical protein [Saprospiraceae bacterium]
MQKGKIENIIVFGGGIIMLLILTYFIQLEKCNIIENVEFSIGEVTKERRSKSGMNYYYDFEANTILVKGIAYYPFFDDMEKLKIGHYYIIAYSSKNPKDNTLLDEYEVSEDVNLDSLVQHIDIKKEIPFW